MKIRISGNTLRFRLSKTEVGFFGNKGKIEEKICFGNKPEQNIIYGLEKSAVTELAATFADNKITVFIPSKIAENWVESNEVGFESWQKIDEETGLKILVEKDLPS